jgi:ankyrin repeat protein
LLDSTTALDVRIDARDERGETALFHACFKGNVQAGTVRA